MAAHHLRTALITGTDHCLKERSSILSSWMNTLCVSGCHANGFETRSAEWLVHAGRAWRAQWTWRATKWRSWTCCPTTWSSTCCRPPTLPAAWCPRRTRSSSSPPKTRGWVRLDAKWFKNTQFSSLLWYCLNAEIKVKPPHVKMYVDSVASFIIWCHLNKYKVS